MTDRVFFLFGEAVESLRRNRGLTVAAVLTVAVSLFLVACVYLASNRLRVATETLTGRFEMRAAMRDGSTEAQVREAIRGIRAVPGIASAVWIPRERAWEVERTKYPPEITRGVENPLPHAFKIRLSDLRAADRVADAVARVPGIAGRGAVTYLREEQRLADRWRRWIASAGSLVVAALLALAGFLVFNATRLALLSRLPERRVMRLVGAHPFVVGAPYVIEGIVQGTVGGLLGGWLADRARDWVEGQIGALVAAPIPPAGGSPLAPIVLVGAVFGGICALLALRFPLKEGR